MWQAHRRTFAGERADDQPLLDAVRRHVVELLVAGRVAEFALHSHDRAPARRGGPVLYELLREGLLRPRARRARYANRTVPRRPVSRPAHRARLAAGQTRHGATDRRPVTSTAPRYLAAGFALALKVSSCGPYWLDAHDGDRVDETRGQRRIGPGGLDTGTIFSRIAAGARRCAHPGQHRVERPLRGSFAERADRRSSRAVRCAAARRWRRHALRWDRCYLERRPDSTARHGGGRRAPRRLQLAERGRGACGASGVSVPRHVPSAAWASVRSPQEFDTAACSAGPRASSCPSRAWRQRRSATCRRTR